MYEGTTVRGLKSSVSKASHASHSKICNIHTTIIYLPFYCVTTHGFHPTFSIHIFHPAGTPDPPKNLGYNDRVVHLQWTRPSYTGGVAVVNYTVSANGRRLEVTNSSQIVRFNTSYLVYGEVKVSAINTCGQESQPAAINIPAKGNCTASVKCHCS